MVVFMKIAPIDSLRYLVVENLFVVVEIIACRRIPEAVLNSIYISIYRPTCQTNHMKTKGKMNSIISTLFAMLAD
jgi:hypothetical protein